jgi:hypothetical protein
VWGFVGFVFETSLRAYNYNYFALYANKNMIYLFAPSLGAYDCHVFDLKSNS